MNRAEVVILGAGPAGISAAIALGPKALLLERRRDPGGLTGTVELEGAIFDVGGHSFHTPHARVKELVYGAVDMREQKRDARCYTHGSLIRYPFQKHFRELPDPAVVEECERSLPSAARVERAPNFEVYLQDRFGSGIAKHFLLPYNRKLWRRDLRLLSADWAGQRVAAPDGVREEPRTNGDLREPLRDDTVVAYPARGGFGEIIKALARKVPNLRLDVAAARVDPERKTVVAESGETFYWDKLVSTIPIDQLTSITTEVPTHLRETAARLDYLSLKLIMVVVGHPIDTRIQRIYATDERIPAHKIALTHNSSDYLRSLPHHGVLGEVSQPDAGSLGNEDIERRFLSFLREIGLIKGAAGEVLKTSVVEVKYAYPVPTLGSEAAVRSLQKWFEARDVYSVGRFGQWAYINSDEAIHRGLSLGEALERGSMTAVKRGGE